MRHRRLATALLVTAPVLAAAALASAAAAPEPRPRPRPEPRHHGRSDWHDDSRLPVVETATRQESYRLGADAKQSYLRG